MLRKWLDLEECADITDDEEDGEDDNAVHDVLEKETKLNLLKEAIANSQRMHEIGATFDDPYLLNTARLQCMHVQELCLAATSTAAAVSPS